MNIKNADTSDVDSVTYLYERLHEFNAALDNRFALADNWRPLFREHFENSYSDPDMLWLLLKYLSVPVGLLIASIQVDPQIFRNPRWVELQALYIVPEFRRKRNATRLLELMYEWCRSRGLDDVRLFVTVSNIHAQEFYASEGFEQSQIILRKLL